MNSDSLARNRTAVESREYVAALTAQLDYDSTSEGQRKLKASLEEAEDPEKIRHLRARLTSGAAASRFRREQVAQMPPGGSPGRKDARFPDYMAVAKSRERLARCLGLAAAEAEVWGRPSPATQTDLHSLYAEVREADRAFRGQAFGASLHPLYVADEGLTAPWTGRLKGHLAPQPADVGVLAALGVVASWDGDSERVVAENEISAAVRWGYEVESLGNGSHVVVSAPRIARYKVEGLVVPGSETASSVEEHPHGPRERSRFADDWDAPVIVPPDRQVDQGSLDARDASRTARPPLRTSAVDSPPPNSA